MLTKIVRQNKLSSKQRDRMFDIMLRYYDGVHREQFDLDLAEKQDVILLLDQSKQIQGFSTILVKPQNFGRKKVIAIFSGDTVLSREYWGQGDLAFAFGKYLVRMRMKHFNTKIYWFLISKGYKTYLLMTNNFAEHWPRHDAETPRAEKSVMDAFYHERFGKAYQATSGLISPSPQEAQALKVNVSEIHDDLLLNPKIKFFAEKNPRWEEGYELCCVARVSIKVPIKYLFKFLKKKSLNFLRRESRRSDLPGVSSRA